MPSRSGMFRGLVAFLPTLAIAVVLFMSTLTAHGTSAQRMSFPRVQELTAPKSNGVDTPTPTTTPVCPPGWGVYGIPFNGLDGSPLRAVAPASPTDVWAVGDIQSDVDTFTLIAHGNSNGWTRVSSPNRGNFANILYGVDAISPNDVWAVGMSNFASGSTIFTLV